MNNKLIITLFSILFFAFSAFGQSKQEAYDNIDVKHYDYTLELSDDTDEIFGKAIITTLVKEETSRVIFDLIGKTGQGKGMKVSKVLVDGDNVPFYLIGDKLELLLPISTKKNTIYKYEIQYHGIPADGLIISKSKNGDRTFFGDNWPNRAHNWLPCKDHPSDKATVTFNVIAPEHYQVIANGIQIEETNLDKGQKYTSWSTDVEIPTKVMVIGVAQFAVKLTGDVHGIPVTSWVYTDDREAGFIEYNKAKDILAYFENKIGPYPYEKLANVQSKTRYGGMENAGNIFYFEQSVTGDETHEDLMAHEIAHQWFGNSVSEKDWQHIWLSEGFATYFADLYYESTYGVDAMNIRLIEEREKVISYSKQRQTALVDETYTDLNTLLNPNSYQKGAWVLHMLRNKIGDKAYWRGIKAFYNSFKGGNAETQDLKNAMENASGIGLTEFFGKWVYNPGHPNMDGEWSFNENSNTLTIQIKNESEWKFPIEIGVYNEDKKLIKLAKFDIHKKDQTLIIPNLKGFNKMVLDPNIKLLFEGKPSEK